MHRGLFVTGTDTGVGKTHIGIQLIHQLNARGIEVAPRKPVESGCKREGNRLIPMDALALQHATGQIESLDEICLFRLEHPLSPERAARIEAVAMPLQAIREACQAPSDRFLLVEGAGGFYSPLASDGLNADLAEGLKLPILLVAADRLGCINHVLLTVHAIEARGLAIAAIVLNQLHRENDSAMDNLEDLQKYLKYPVVRTGYLADPNALAATSGVANLVDVLLAEISAKHKA